MENKEFSKQYSRTDYKIQFVLINGKHISGYINITGYDRYSDFIENDKIDHLKVYNCESAGKKYNLLIIPKRNILMYIE